MNICTKFFALAGILLLLFGAVVGLLTLLQDATAHKLEDIALTLRKSGKPPLPTGLEAILLHP